MNAPVLIVGAGPVGMTLGMALQRLGVEVRIVDKAAARTDKSKALVLWPRTLELLDVQGCVETFLQSGQYAVGARILAEGKLLTEIRLDTARSVYRAALMIPQSETERLLEEQLALLGVQIEREMEMTSFLTTDAGVATTLRHADGREESITASYLIGCDGAHSTVRHGLDAAFDGDTLASDWVLADLSLEGNIPRDEINICWAPQGVLILFPINGSRFRVIADIKTDGQDTTPPKLEAIQALIDERGPPGLRAHDPIWMSNFHINERKVKDYRKGPVFLCGDAAHVHSPAGGQGMNTGMQDAFNLAWKMAMVWHGHASPGLLDSYSPERSAIGEQVLKNAGNLTKIALLRNPILQEIRSLAVGALGEIPALRQRMVDQLTEIDLNYRGIGLTSNHQTRGSTHRPAAGERAPDVPLVGHEASRLHDALRRGRFMILSVGVAPPVLPKPLQLLATAAQAQTNDECGYERGNLYLIRPDAYVLLSCNADDAAPILDALRSISG